MDQIIKHPKILNRETTGLLIIDIQERILPVINENERVIENAIKLIKAFNILNLPVFLTEQYPKGLGQTTEIIQKELKNYSPIHKMTFSCSGAEGLFQSIKGSELKQIVVCGIETHVCVQQTVMDLLANGFQVNLAADAVSSRKQFDYEIALKRMQTLGAEITTTESILFEVLSVCGTPEFKEISKIVK